MLSVVGSWPDVSKRLRPSTKAVLSHVLRYGLYKGSKGLDTPMHRSREILVAKLNSSVSMNEFSRVSGIDKLKHRFLMSINAQV